MDQNEINAKRGEYAAGLEAVGKKEEPVKGKAKTAGKAPAAKEGDKKEEAKPAKK